MTAKPASFVCQEAIDAWSVEISLTHGLCFFQCASDKHFLALSGLCNRDKPSPTPLNKPEKAFFQQEKRDDSKL